MSYDTIGLVKLLLGSVAIALLVLRLRQRGSLDTNRTETLVLGALAVLGLAVFFHFGWFHSLRSNYGWATANNYIHNGDCFHYYVGAKYFDELGYTGLYEAAAVADAQTDGFLRPDDRIRDLATYRLIPARSVLERATAIEGRFTPERWRQFVHDVGLFKHRRTHGQAAYFRQLMQDHGFNATPVWIQTGRALCSWVPAEHVVWLALLDLPLWIIAFALIGQTLGLKPMLAAVLFTSIDFVAAPFVWGLGSILRADWLVATVAAFCALRSGRHGWAGGLLAYATMVRIFPMLLLFGIAINALHTARAHQRLPPSTQRLFVGFVATAVALLGYGSLSMGISVWPAFIHNISLHGAQLADNTVGLERLIHVDIARVISERRGLVPSRDGLVLLASAASLLLLTRVVRGLDDDEAFLWGIALMFATLSLTNYYYSIVLLWVAHEYAKPVTRRSTAVLIGLVGIQVVGHLVRGPMLDDTLWYRAFFWVSVLMFAGFVMLAIDQARRAPSPS